MPHVRRRSRRLIDVVLWYRALVGQHGDRRHRLCGAKSTNHGDGIVKGVDLMVA